MPKTVNEAFNRFLLETVNLDKEQTATARSSKDWLLQQVALFGNDDTFPKLYLPYNVHLGSFSRRTKTRPLDDIDLLIGLNAQGASYREHNDKIEITVNPETNLKAFCNDNSDILNSRKVINKFISKLSDIPQYSKAEIKRNLEAATLNLTTRTWVFDIVPCFFTSPDLFGKTFYLIPDGIGNWKKTDPRIDKDRAVAINQSHNGYLLNVIRIIKYWNKRPTMPSMSSYLLETIIFNYYENRDENEKASNFVDIEIPKVLEHIESRIYHPVDDHKGIQGDINSLSWDEKIKISNRAKTDKEKASNARKFENDDNHEASILKWQEIFGYKFPNYE